jgi:hypothetical protein
MITFKILKLSAATVFLFLFLPVASQAAHVAFFVGGRFCYEAG